MGTDMLDGDTLPDLDPGDSLSKEYYLRYAVDMLSAGRHPESLPQFIRWWNQTAQEERRLLLILFNRTISRTDEQDIDAIREDLA